MPPLDGGKTASPRGLETDGKVHDHSLLQGH